MQRQAHCAELSTELLPVLWCAVRVVQITFGIGDVDKNLLGVFVSVVKPATVKANSLRGGGREGGGV